MSGGGGGIIIIKNLKAALSVGCNASGSIKLWMAVIAFGLVCFGSGALLVACTTP